MLGKVGKGVCSETCPCTAEREHLTLHHVLPRPCVLSQCFPNYGAGLASFWELMQGF